MLAAATPSMSPVPRLIAAMVRECIKDQLRRAWHARQCAFG
jgi:hypothetical protein